MRIEVYGVFGPTLGELRRQWQAYVFKYHHAVNTPVSFKVDMRRLTAQLTMEAEHVAAALTMKEVVFSLS